MVLQSNSGCFSLWRWLKWAHDPNKAFSDTCWGERVPEFYNGVRFREDQKMKEYRDGQGSKNRETFGPFRDYGIELRRGLGGGNILTFDELWVGMEAMLRDVFNFQDGWGSVAHVDKHSTRRAGGGGNGASGGGNFVQEGSKSRTVGLFLRRICGEQDALTTSQCKSARVGGRDPHSAVVCG